MILSKPQAESIYRAIVELNNVGAILSLRLDVNNTGTYLYVKQAICSGEIFVSFNSGGAIRSFEKYADQNEFVSAYDLQ